MSTTSQARRVGYDRVQVPMNSGEARMMTKEEFEKLPLRERVDFIMDGKLKFFLNGEAVTPLTALKGGY